jgi:hypothetical protein
MRHGVISSSGEASDWLLTAAERCRSANPMRRRPDSDRPIIDHRLFDRSQIIDPQIIDSYSARS